MSDLISIKSPPKKGQVCLVLTKSKQLVEAVRDPKMYGGFRRDIAPGVYVTAGDISYWMLKPELPTDVK